MAHSKLFVRSIAGACLTLGALCFAPPASANTDNACVSLVSSSALSQNSTVDSLVVVKTHKLTRRQARPFMIIPTGAALYVKAPQGVTAADLHNMVQRCNESMKNSSSPLCAPGASLRVRREGGLYVIEVTSDTRSEAVEIQRRAEALR